MKGENSEKGASTMNSEANLINSFEKWILKEGKTQNTVQTYIGVLQKFSDFLETNKKDITNFSKSDVQSYMDFLDSQNRSASTIDKVFATIRVFANFTNNTNAVLNIKRKTKETHIYKIIPETLTKDEIKKLLARILQGNNIRNTAIVYTLLYTGMRVSELCNLNHGDINFNDKIITIHDSSGRKVPITKNYEPYLKQYIDMKEDKEDAVFLSNFNKRMTTRAVQYMLKKYDVNPHLLRHTFCKNLIIEGVDVETVAKLAGHSDINVTRRYNHYLQADIEDSVS